MKKSHHFPLGGPCALLLTVVLSGCETPLPPARYPARSTLHISTADHRPDARTTDDTPPPVRRRTPPPSSKHMAARHPEPSPTKTQGASAMPSARPPGKVESEVQDPSDVKTSETARQRKTDARKMPTPAKVDSEVRNPTDLR